MHATGAEPVCLGPKYLGYTEPTAFCTAYLEGSPLRAGALRKISEVDSPRDPGFLTLGESVLGSAMMTAIRFAEAEALRFSSRCFPPLCPQIQREAGTARPWLALWPWAG
jgi:hypothetical protein